MPEFDHHPESESRYRCSHCEETGIDIESREYCTACELGKRRMNLDRLAEPLRHHLFTNAMWVAHHSAMKTERAIAAADLALLKSKLLQAECELAEVRKVQAATTGNEWAEAQRIQDLPDVNDDLRGWLEEAREENEVQGVAFHACSIKLKQAEEELAKEKERADRAEDHRDKLCKAIASAAIKAGIYNGEVDLTGPHLLMLANDLAEQAILAQPLQQEGGKDGFDRDTVLTAMRKIREHCRYNETTEAYHLADSFLGSNPPQPSDNLQQASTAQEVDRDAVLESAVQAVADRVGAADRIMAVNAYDAIRSLKSNRFAPHESAAQAEPWADFEVEPTGDAHYDAGNFLLNAAQEFWNACRHAGQYGAVQWLTGENGELLIYTRGEYRETLMRNIEKIPGQEVKHFAQATPEGAELPPPKYASVMAIADEFGSGAVAYTANEVRAALAANQQAAEPVYQAFSPSLGAWLDLVSGDEMADYGGAGYQTRILYRAAPPQQVEPECCNHDCNQGRDCPNRKR